MRLGRVSFNVSYVVDLDNPEMVDEATDCIFDNIISVCKHNEILSWVKNEEDSSLQESDIPDFLLETEEEDDEDDEDDEDGVEDEDLEDKE